MDTQKLYAIAIIVAAISAGYYYFGGKSNKLEVDSSRNMTYAAEQINLTQTDEAGQLEIKAKADRLEQDLQKKTAHLDHLIAQKYQNGRVDSKFYAAVANSFDDNQRVVLSDQVVVKRLLPQGEMTLNTHELTIFPKQREMETQKPVQVDYPQAQFTSQGLKANLNNGQYEFFNIRGRYEP